ncbi:MAG: hypothetical protein IPP19_14600 [Verrucomicrobia bacterium]|nr:hypothetical protein [Verrucomicrobiota bacterium]
MNDSLYFRLVLATVFVGALLAIFDPANRSTTVTSAQPAPATTSQIASAS